MSSLWWHVLGLLLFVGSVKGAQTMNCKNYYMGNCTDCGANLIVFENKCYAAIPGCLSYSGGDCCSACDPAISTLQNGSCLLNTGASFGKAIVFTGPSSQLILLNETEKINDNCFNQLDASVRQSPSGSSITLLLSVSKGIFQSVASYQLLYQTGSSQLAAFMSCTIATSPTTTLISSLPIPTGQVVANCAIYSTGMACLQCTNEYHLDGGNCYYNYPLCSSYYREICLKCSLEAVLVENKCSSSCSNADTRSLPFFGATM